MKKQSTKTSQTSWGKEADWYDSYLTNADSYQSQVIGPNLKRIWNLTKKHKVLDLACGQGYFSFEMAKISGEVVGVDISPELIALANRNKNSVHDGTYKNLSFNVANAESFKSKLNLSNDFDTCVCVLAAQNIQDFGIAIKEVSSVLKKGGKFILIINHPAFRVPQESDWHFDAVKKKQGRVVYKYLSEQKIQIDMHPGERDPRKKSYTLSFHRPLQVFSKWFNNAGFAIQRIEEWGTHKKSNKGARFTAEEEAKKEIPLFMCFECVKF